MKFKDLKVGECFVVNDSYGNTAIVKKINNSRSIKRENTRVISGKHEWSFGVCDSWFTRPSTEVKKINK